jgi:hypothetical protein
VPMYEYTPWPCPVEPDTVICPSNLDYDYYRGLHHNNRAPYSCPVFRIDIPTEVKWRLRTHAKVYIHNAGHGGKDYRNGTLQLIEAMKLVESPIELLLRVQTEDSKMKEVLRQTRQNPRIYVEEGNLPEESLWEEGDVFVFPERFNGLSLPLQEAYAAGMLVMATDRYPMNTWLPRRPLIPKYGEIRKKLAIEFTESLVSPSDIALKMDEWYGENIQAESLRGKAFAYAMSWEYLKPMWHASLLNSIEVMKHRRSA